MINAFEGSKKEIPGWQDISLEEVDVKLAAGEVAAAVVLAKTRLRALETIPDEIADAVLESTEYTSEQWEEVQKSIKREIDELQTIIAAHGA